MSGVKPGVYIQNFNHVYIGDNVRIAPGVKIISRNHNVQDVSRHDEYKDIHIENNCWIGANTVILPGITLGENTIVGAGSVVTKSFVDGYCIIAGNPAKLIRKLDKT